MSGFLREIVRQLPAAADSAKTGAAVAFLISAPWFVHLLLIAQYGVGR